MNTEPVREDPLEPLRRYVDDGYEVFYVAGVPGAGKSELVRACRERGYPRPAEPVGPTPAGSAIPTPIGAGRRKVVLVDSSGHDLEALRPRGVSTRRDGVPSAQLKILRLLMPRLRGLVLAVDLPSLAEYGKRQEELLGWLLAVLRWLGRPEEPTVEPSLGFRQTVTRDVVRLPRRLRVPVAVLLTRADEAHGTRLPGVAGGRPLFPVGEHPLHLAHHVLPGLCAALRTHADHYRFDLAHAFVADRDTGEVVDPEPCGIHAAVDWLLDPAWRFTAWQWPTVPTRVWIDVLRFADERLLRRDVWRRLPDPEDLG